MAKKKKQSYPLGKRGSKKVIGIETTKNYVVEDFKNPPKSQVIAYRTKKLPDGHLARIAILKKKGPRGGRTVITSLWHPKTERESSNKHVERVLRAARKKRR